MLKNKKNIIIAGIAVLILITALILTLTNRKQAGMSNQNGNPVNNTVAEPEFLTAQEKAYLNLSDNVRAQVLSRNASGAPAVYKVIKTDADIIIDSAKIAPISPRLVEAAK